MQKGLNESTTTKIVLGVIIAISFLFLGIAAYKRNVASNALAQKRQELMVYNNGGLKPLRVEKSRLEKELKFLQSSCKDISDLLFAKPASKMTKEVGDPLKFKEELYRVQVRIKENGSMAFPFWLGFDRYEHDIPNSSDLPNRIKQLDTIEEICKAALASKIPEISGIEFLEVKKIFADNSKETLYVDLPVKISIKCNNNNLINFMQKISVADLLFRVDSLKVKIDEEDGTVEGDLKAEFVIIASVLPADKI